VKQLLSVDEALGLLLAHTPNRPDETVSLDKALGRTLAAPVKARLTQPPASVSAMDGYAVHLSDISQKGTRLNVIGESPAGRPFQGSIDPGQAVRIFTGGHVPAGADTILIQENAERHGDEITVIEPQDAARHIRKAGIDFAKGDILLEAGMTLGPAEVAVAAAANHASVTVRSQLKVALLANGNELKPPGSDLGAGEIVSSNQAGLSALIASWGDAVIDLGIASDSIEDILSRLNSASEADIIVPIGGASVGDHDHMRAAFSEAGFELVFEKIAVRPGKPTWFAKKVDQLVLGLPGHPASAYVCANLFLYALLKGKPRDIIRAKLSGDLSENGPRAHYMRAHLALSDTGDVVASPLPNQDSSLLTPFLSAGGLILREPGAPAVNSGNEVSVVALRPIISG